MMKEQEIDWLTQQTGDPFTDVGGYVWAYLIRENPDKKPIEIIELVARIYIYDWEQKMHPFFANSKITHNSYGGKRERSLKDTVLFYGKVLKSAPDVVVNPKGYCRITGQRTALLSAERSTTMLNGAGSLLNFHHAFEGGSMVSKEVLIRNFAMPLGVVQVGSMPAAVLSNDERISRFIVEENCRKHLERKGINLKSGLRKSKASNPANALFDYVMQVSKKVEYKSELEEIDEEGVSLNLFHFSNFVNGPALGLHTLSAAAFGYFSYCLKHYRREWMAFVNAHYKVRAEKKKDKDTPDEDIRSFPNPVLNTILKGGNLTFQFLAWVRSGQTLSFHIVELYQILIRNMDKRTIEVMRRIATFVAQNCSDDETKRVLRLRGANTKREVFKELLRLVNMNKDNQEPLIKLDDVEFLFPEGYSWIEMRNILLIAIYEQLHVLNRKVGDVGEVDEAEDELTEENN